MNIILFKLHRHGDSHEESEETRSEHHHHSSKRGEHGYSGDHDDEHRHHTYTDAKGRELVAVYVPDEYMETIYAVVKTMQEHPETWEKYMTAEHGLADIINMEIGELQMRMKEKKDGKASYADVARELKHVAAACLCKYKKIQKMYE